MSARRLLPLALVAALCCHATPAADPPPKVKEVVPLAGTKPLTMTGDIASQLVAGVDKFLLREIDGAQARRDKAWKVVDRSSPEKYQKSLEPFRKRLAHILGVRDPRVPFEAPTLVGTTKQPALVGKGPNYEVFAVRWPALDGVHGEGLLLVPSKGKPVADVIAIPDADVTPEQLVGLMAGVPAESQYARRLAESGCRVLVPVLIDRTYAARNGRAKMTNREYLYRPAFELGRHIIGYELQKILAGVDWFQKEGGGKTGIGVFGWGEGGLLALFAGALDTRINVVGVSGAFGGRQAMWQEPIDRNVFGLLELFGDGELAAMIAPRAIVVECAKWPAVKLPSEGGAPGRLPDPGIDGPVEGRKVWAERTKGLKPRPRFAIHISLGLGPRNKHGLVVMNAPGPYGTDEALQSVLTFLDTTAKVPPGKKLPEHLRKGFDPKPRQQRQLQEIDRHTQRLLAESPYVRKQFMSKLDTSSLDKYKKTVEPYREFFATEIIGRFDHKLLPPNARTRKIEENEKWTRYQVVLDVFPDVIAYGLLTIPKDIKPNEKRPVVVCQHGLEGRPEHCIGKEGHGSYKAFATQLAERGFITFAPQNLYIFRDRFRTLQRKANPIGKTLFSIIVPQHQQITDWLKSLPFVDASRIAFYGLSYGGKTAMRVPPLVSNYCLSICSADFNDWVWKNASTRSPYSYVWTVEYEIFEFDLGSTFNYSEMAALIAPRPFMVERGHFDGVAPDERVAYEFAKVRHLYQARLGIGGRTEIEWFVGPHTINGKGTFEFLHKHLKWAKR
jgi:dienelactone hydrolase